jgi:hypothetical protein
MRRSSCRMSKSGLAALAIFEFMAECERTGILVTEFEREQRFKKLFRLVLDIEQAATEAAVAELFDDLETGKLLPRR